MTASQGSVFAVQLDSAAPMGTLCKIYVMPNTVISILTTFNTILERIAFFSGISSNLYYYIYFVIKMTLKSEGL